MTGAGKCATPALDRLAELDQAVADAKGRARALRRDAAEHDERREQLRRQRVEAYASDDESRATALKKKTTDADARADELAERVAGADLAVQRAEADRVGWIGQHYGELLKERTPVALAAVQALRRAAEVLAQAVAAWNAEWVIQNELARVAGHNPLAVPGSVGPAGELSERLTRAAERLEAPMPRDAAPVLTIDPPPPGFEALGPGAMTVADGRAIGVVTDSLD